VSFRTVHENVPLFVPLFVPVVNLSHWGHYSLAACYNSTGS
jgi:hypothetical protein